MVFCFSAAAFSFANCSYFNLFASAIAFLISLCAFFAFSMSSSVNFTTSDFLFAVYCCCIVVAAFDCLAYFEFSFELFFDVSLFSSNLMS